MPNREEMEVGITEGARNGPTMQDFVTPRLPLQKRILFTGAAILLGWMLVEALLHILTYFGVMPYLPTVTPSCYTKETVKFKIDRYGCPIFVDGHKVYRQIGMPAKLLLLDSEGYRPIDAQRFGSSDYKIAFFGDSYTEGLQVDDLETFPRLIEKGLRQIGKHTICFNFGIGGTGTYHQYLRYLTASQETYLDDVVLCFLPQNDVLNNHEKLGKPFELPGVPYLVIRDGEFVGQHSDADTAHVNQRLIWLRETIGTSFVATGMYRFWIRWKTDAKKRKMAVWETRTRWLGVYGPPLNDDWREAWAITEEMLLRFAGAARERNSRFTLVIVADSLQITDSTLLDPELASTCDFEYPNRRLKEFCKKHGIVCLDSLPFFLKKKPTLDYPYFSWKHDGHYSQVGHQTMAAFLNATDRFAGFR